MAEQPNEYQCPGETHSISRAVHLGRLARFFPGCRQCPHRDDTGTLSQRQVGRLIETRHRGQTNSVFGTEGVSATVNEFTPAIARGIAATFGVWLQRDVLVEKGQKAVIAHPTTVVLANDGQARSGELLASVSEGVRWAGAELVDIGPATSASLAFVLNRMKATGGILVATPRTAADDRRIPTVDMKLWHDNARPLCRKTHIAELRGLFEQGVERPTRSYGSTRRESLEAEYLAAMRPFFHALRPLTIVLWTSSAPWASHFQTLLHPTACEIIRTSVTKDAFGEKVVANSAHLGLLVDDNGEVCRVYDESGQTVPDEALLRLVTEHVFSPGESNRSNGNNTRKSVVLDSSLGRCGAEAVRSFGVEPFLCGSSRDEMDDAMRQHRAILGAGSGGRFVYGVAQGPPIPDSLVTTAYLLAAVSRNDRPFSALVTRTQANVIS